MATTPQILTHDGSYTSQLVLSTNRSSIQLTGTVSANTIDLQVSINGGAYVSDSNLVKLDGTAFTIPNPDNLEGLPLSAGQTNILIRAIDLLGGVSPSATAQITKVTNLTTADQMIPTGIKVKRNRNTVDVLVAKKELFAPGGGENETQLDFKGFNFYASTSPAGTTGRFRINNSPVLAITTAEEVTTPIDGFTTTLEPIGNFLRTRITQEDGAGNTLGVVADNVVDILVYNNTLKSTTDLKSSQMIEYVQFRHSRTGTLLDNTINSDQFSDLLATDPVYYTVTAVYYDPALKQEVETPHSQEVLGSPIILDTTLKDLPGRAAFSIVTDFISAIQRVNKNISLIPGSVTRDVDIDPFSSEAERIWFLIDFVHRSQSVLTLLQIDDVDGDGISDPVASSSYKQALKAALGLSSDNAVQTLIDTQFDKLAANVRKTRGAGRAAFGEAVLYRETKPTVDTQVSSGAVFSAKADPDLGLAAARYISGGSYFIPLSDIEAYYNYDTRLYEVTVSIFAESLGTSSNRPADSLDTIVSGVTGGWKVKNIESISYGQDRQTNTELAVQTQLGFVSVDTGTEGGYLNTAAGTTGILKTKIVKSGDPLMMRDWDDVRKKHIGGKVDVWVQGLKERTVTEKFAFYFEVARDIRCLIVDVATLTFKVLDSRVTPATPIMELLDNLGLGLGVRNTTTGQDYDLSGAILIDYQTFRLNTAIPQPATAYADIVTADYRFKNLNKFTFSLQPVRRVVSVVGQASGPLTTAGFTLYKDSDPLLEGESTISTDYMAVTPIGGIPSGITLNVTSEPHTFVGFFPEVLKNLGIDITSIKVYNEDRSVQFSGPSAVTPDYDIVLGTATTAVKLIRTQNSTILSGQKVVVDYDHDENFTVTYVINDLLQQLQRTVNVSRHITGDVLVKQAIDNKVDIDSTVQLKVGAKKDKADPLIRTSVSVEVNSRLISQGLAQSDVVNAIDSTTGVENQVLPMARMGYAEGSLRLRESVANTNYRIPSLDIGGQSAFILSSALKYPTTDGGGLITEHKGVFQDDEPMSLASDLALVCSEANSAFIIGASGASIAGFSDDATLISEGFTDPEDLIAERLARTANKIVISLSSSGSPTDNPDLHSYAVSYVVRGDKGPHDIVPTDVEVLSLGYFDLTIREG